MNWFKVYIGAVLQAQDPGRPGGSLSKLDEAELGVWVKLMALAGRLDESGRFQVNGVQLSEAQVVAMLRCRRPAVAAAAVNKLLGEDVGVLGRDQDATLFVKNWSVYQSEYETKKWKKGQKPRRQKPKEEKSPVTFAGQSVRSSSPDKMTVPEETREEKIRLKGVSDVKAFEVAGEGRTGPTELARLIPEIKNSLEGGTPCGSKT